MLFHVPLPDIFQQTGFGRNGRLQDGSTGGDQSQQGVKFRAQSSGLDAAALSLEQADGALQQPGTRGIQCGNGGAVERQLFAGRPGKIDQSLFQQRDALHRPCSRAADRCRTGHGFYCCLPDLFYCHWFDPLKSLPTGRLLFYAKLRRVYCIKPGFTSGSSSMQKPSAKTPSAGVYCYCLLVSSNDHRMIRRYDNRIVAGLENEQPDKKAENRDENTRKECRPESRHLEAGNNR